MSLIQVTLTQFLKGQVVQNVLHFDNPESQFDGPTMGGIIKSGWIAKIRQIQATQLVYNQLVIQNLQDPTQAPYVENLAIAGSATGFDARLVPVSVVIQKRTAQAGRRGRGRTYIAGWDTGSLETTGTWTVGHLAGIFHDLEVGLMENFGPNGTAGLKLQVAGKGPDNDWLGHQVTQIVFRPIPGYQRRRNIGTGI